ncbi:oxidative damage protection protein [bacterium CPR1]|nr:oxidative damage protection protein [bacterium CPR1]
MRMVQCVKLKEELPGLPSPPIPGPLGEKVYENVSAQAWKMFEEYFLMVINENRLDMIDENTDDIFFQQVEAFLFTDTARPPEGYVPRA